MACKFTCREIIIILFLQVSDVIINNLCYLVSLESEHLHSACQATLLMLTTHPGLHIPILVRLWELIRYQVETSFS